MSEVFHAMLPGNCQNCNHHNGTSFFGASSNVLPCHYKFNYRYQILSTCQSAQTQHGNRFLLKSLHCLWVCEYFSTKFNLQLQSLLNLILSAPNLQLESSISIKLLYCPFREARCSFFGSFNPGAFVIA